MLTGRTRTRWISERLIGTSSWSIDFGDAGVVAMQVAHADITLVATCANIRVRVARYAARFFVSAG